MNSKFTAKALKMTISAAVLSACMMISVGALYTGETTASQLNLRAEPNGAILTTVPEGSKVAIISNTDPSWYRVAVNGMTGFVSSQYVKGSPDADFNVGGGIVTGDLVNFRSRPTTESDILATFSQGTQVSVIGVESGWYKIQMGNTAGYMHPDYIAIQGSAAAAPSREASATASAKRQEVVNFAAKFLGTPYVYGGTSPKGFDCSGLTYYVYKNTVREIPRTASTQKAALTNITMDELLPGDLVFFRNSGSGNGVGHAGIYVGEGKFIHSPNTGDVVKYSTLWSGSYNRNFICGGRVIFD